MNATTAPATDAVKAVESIGRRGASLDRDTATLAAQIIASVPEGYDWTARGAKPGAVHAFCAVEGVDTPAVATGPKGAQTRTNYGKGVDALVKSITKALAPTPLPVADGQPEDSETPTPAPVESTPDYLALAVEAVSRALANGSDLATILAAVEASHVLAA